MSPASGVLGQKSRKLFRFLPPEKFNILYFKFEKMIAPCEVFYSNFEVFYVGYFHDKNSLVKKFTKVNFLSGILPE